MVLLVWWMQGEGQRDGIQVIEYFAGVARIASIAKWVGYRSAAFDRDFGKKNRSRKNKSSRLPMDLNSNAGLAFFGCSLDI